MDAGRVYSVGTQVSDKFRFALLIPDFQLKTEQSRATLPMQYSKQDAVYNLSRSALMVASLSCGKAENLRIAVQDKLHQPFRVDLIENCAEILSLLTKMVHWELTLAEQDRVLCPLSKVKIQHIIIV